MARAKGSTRTAAHDLWARYQKSRRRELRDRLIEQYLPVVRSEAARLARRLPRHVDSDDLVSAGVIGLVRSIEAFDPERGVKFRTYCRKRVMGSMIDELRRQDHIPREARDRADVLRSTVQSLRDELAREPSDREIAAEIGVTPRAVRETLRDVAFSSWLPLEAAEKGGADEGRVLRFEPIDHVPEPSEAAVKDEIIQLVEHQLSRRERAIVRSYYHDDQTMKRIGHRLRLSESRVCQMHNRMLSRLKRQLREVAP